MKHTKLRPVVLCILDGWGHREAADNNAIKLGRTPIFDRLWQQAPHALLRTSAGDVGLPDGQMGNSEVGHQNLGAGRVVQQDLPRINRAVVDGTLAGNPVLGELVTSLANSGGACHLIGLLSPGGVHAHSAHIEVTARRRRTLFVEMTLLDGINDSTAQAGALAAFLEPFGPGVRINLLPMNPGRPEYRPSPMDRAVAFQQALRGRGYFCALRRARGADCNAACGQLATAGE